MASLKGDSSRVIYKINEENFNIWKLTLEMRLASMDLWGIVDEYEEYTFQHWSQSEEIPKMYKTNNVYHCVQLYSQPTCAHEELQKTNEGMKNALRHVWDNEPIQHALCSLRIVHVCKM